MKRALLFGLSALALAAGTSPRAAAQPQRGLVSLYYVGASLAVTQPASIAGSKAVTKSIDNSWGGNPDTANIVNIPVSRVAPDTLACNPISTNLVGKVALVFRGSCEFGAKALAAQNAGAKAVIIVNNIPGAPVGMGVGAVGGQVTIPVFMVSQDDGMAMNNALRASQNVTVTYSRWGLGFANDLGITPNSMALPHAQAMPRTQMTAANGNPAAYRNYMGAFVGNFGTATQTNTKLRMTTMWYPNTGAPMMIRRDSIINATFAPIDSIQDAQNVSATSFQLNPASNGRYSFRYDVSSATGPDQNSANNTDSVSLLVTDSVFAKGGWNPATGNLVLSGGRAYAGNGLPATIGPLFYMARSRYIARKAQFSVYRYDPSNTANVALDGTPDVFITVYRWIDGRGGAPMDSIIEGSELRPIAAGVKVFQAGDSSGETYTVPLKDFNNDQRDAILADSGWYWVAVTTDNDSHYPAVSELNYYTRSYAARAATQSYKEFWAPMVQSTNSSVDTTSPTDSLSMFLFSYQGYDNILQVPYTGLFTTAGPVIYPPSEDYAPAVALHISNNPASTTSVGDVAASAFRSLELFPNPAGKELNVTYSFADPSARATFHIMNSMGQSVRRKEVSNTQSGTVSIPVSDLAAGQYYLLVGANGKTIGRSFTIGLK